MPTYLAYPEVRQITLQRRPPALGEAHDPERAVFTSTLFDLVISAHPRSDIESGGPGLTLNFHDPAFGAFMLGQKPTRRSHHNPGKKKLRELLRMTLPLRQTHLYSAGYHWEPISAEYVPHDVTLITPGGLSVRCSHELASQVTQPPHPAHDPGLIHLRWHTGQPEHAALSPTHFLTLLHVWEGWATVSDPERHTLLAEQQSPQTFWIPQHGHWTLGDHTEALEPIQSRLGRLHALLRSEPRPR